MVDGPMTSVVHPTPRDRIGAAAITALLTAALGYALIAGLSVRLAPAAQSALAIFDLTPPPPPAPPATVQQRDRAPLREGAASPPNLKSRATEVAAPVAIVPIAIPPLLVTADKPAAGNQATSGNAPIAGPGTGSGGIGDGTGSGGSGDGAGGGGGTPPRRIEGRIRNSDYPRSAGDAGIGGTVSVLFVVAPSGRVTDCEITRSSGDAALDDTTCDLIIKRFRFDPARDRRGRPVESMVEENHSWMIR